MFINVRIRYTPEEFILFEGVPDDSSIYFIENGIVEMLIRQQCLNGEIKYQTICVKLLDHYLLLIMNITNLQEVNRGQFFGQVSFFTGQARSLSVRCKDFTTLLKIERQEFLNLLEKYPYDQEKFFSIKEKLTFGKQFEEIGGNCYNCGDRFHQIYECPIIHYEVNRVQLLCQHRYSCEQERKLFKRLNVKFKTKSIVNVKDLTQVASEFVENNYDLFENREDWIHSSFLMNTEQFNRADDKNYQLRYMKSQITEQDNSECFNQDEILQGITEEIEDSKAGNQSYDLRSSKLINDLKQSKNLSQFRDRSPSIAQSNEKIKSESKVSVCDIDDHSYKRLSRLSSNLLDEASNNIYIYQTLNLLNKQQPKFNTLQQILDKNVEQNINQLSQSKKNLSALDVLNNQVLLSKPDLQEKSKESQLKFQKKNFNTKKKTSSIIVTSQKDIYQNVMQQQSTSAIASQQQAPDKQSRIRTNSGRQINNIKQRMFNRALTINPQQLNQSNASHSNFIQGVLSSQQNQQNQSSFKPQYRSQKSSISSEHKISSQFQPNVLLEGLIESLGNSPHFQTVLQDRMKNLQEQMLQQYIPDQIANNNQQQMVSELLYDCMKSYKYYFPEYNIDKVIERIKKVRTQQIRSFLLRHQQTLTNKYKYFKKRLAASNPFTLRDLIQQRHNIDKIQQNKAPSSPLKLRNIELQNFSKLKENKEESSLKQIPNKSNQQNIEELLPPLPLRRLESLSEKTDKLVLTLNRSPTLTNQSNKVNIKTKPVIPSITQTQLQNIHSPLAPNSNRKSAVQIRVTEANSPSKSGNNSPVVNSFSSSYKIGKTVSSFKN